MVKKRCGSARKAEGESRAKSERNNRERTGGEIVICTMKELLAEADEYGRAVGGFNVANMESIHNHISELDSLLCTLLVENEIDFSINGDSSSRAAGILNIAISGIDGEGLLNMLDMHDICISIGSACNSKSQDRSHVLLAMGLDEARIDSSVRISIGRYNTEDDIRTLVKWIANYHKIAKLAEA